MIIAVPVDENKIEICPSFARTPYYMFYNTQTNNCDVIENPAAQAEGGAGIKAAQFIIDNKADVVITPRCGENAAEILKEAEMKIYKSEGNNATENINKFKENKLSELTKFHAGFHGIK